MEQNIIKKAIEGGFTEDVTFYTHIFPIQQLKEMILRPLFWQALGKACGWKKFHCSLCMSLFDKMGLVEHCGKTGHYYAWETYAVHFHFINMRDGWNAAIKYLSDLTTS